MFGTFFCATRYYAHAFNHFLFVLYFTLRYITLAFVYSIRFALVTPAYCQVSGHNAGATYVCNNWSQRCIAKNDFDSRETAARSWSAAAAAANDDDDDDDSRGNWSDLL